MVLRQHNLLAEADEPGGVCFLTTGAAAPYARQVEQLLGLADVVVETAVWTGEQLSVIRNR